MGPISSELTLTKEKERRKRKSEEEERRRREKSNGCTLTFYHGYFGEKKNCWTEKVHLAATFSKIRLDIREKENSGNPRKHTCKERFHKLWSAGNTQTSD